MHHLECAAIWHNNWQQIQSSTKEKLQQMEAPYNNLNKNLKIFNLSNKGILQAPRPTNSTINYNFILE